MDCRTLPIVLGGCQLFHKQQNNDSGMFCCCDTGESICCETLLVSSVESTNWGTHKVASEYYGGGYVRFMVQKKKNLSNQNGRHKIKWRLQDVEWRKIRRQLEQKGL
jgi:hypothetical protein